ncbi:helix-turn-helix domain-containing protein [Candidatus Halocynthiibacter alkanivorans]|uniref:helix-turn-helix domain-containing protein n=1 Tax=Candidatus Halocynthiibacter alkanivorans TaxID=2267619 RepID=UPI000DF44074|nr:helix-turn-helix transcriptional regulator [Candidatus Halocynthiibacter alkanivorans]
MLAKQNRGASDATKEQRAIMGRWLKSLREARGLSQRELAEILSLEYYTFISQLEHGRGKIPPARYIEWAAALNQDPKDFVKTLFSYYEPIAYEIMFGEATG